ncbi:MAG: sugar-binding protein, partial [Bacteroidota bacterium]
MNFFFINSLRRIFSVVAGILLTQHTSANNDPLPATMLSQFTSTSIRIDGTAEATWNTAKSYRIGIAMTSDLTATAPACTTYGEVRSLWDGAMLYLLIDITDADVTTAGQKLTDKDAVEIYFDLWNDKFPKYEEDDGIMRINCAGELSGSGVYADRLKEYAAAARYNSEKVKMGYTVELAINIGGVPMKNGSS